MFIYVMFSCFAKKRRVKNASFLVRLNFSGAVFVVGLSSQKPSVEECERNALCDGSQTNDQQRMVNIQKHAPFIFVNNSDTFTFKYKSTVLLLSS